MLSLIVALAPPLALGACASADDSGGTAYRRNATLISHEEVLASTASNALEFIQAARPGWLRKGGSVSFSMDGEVLVYLDDHRLGGIGTLHSIQLSGIRTIRFLDAVTATARFGLSHPHGAIQVQSRTRAR